MSCKPKCFFKQPLFNTTCPTEQTFLERNALCKIMNISYSSTLRITFILYSLNWWVILFCNRQSTLWIWKHTTKIRLVLYYNEIIDLCGLVLILFFFLNWRMTIFRLYIISYICIYLSFYFPVCLLNSHNTLAKGTVHDHLNYFM